MNQTDPGYGWVLRAVLARVGVEVVWADVIGAAAGFRPPEKLD